MWLQSDWYHLSKHNEPRGNSLFYHSCSVKCVTVLVLHSLICILLVLNCVENITASAELWVWRLKEGVEGGRCVCVVGGGGGGGVQEDDLYTWRVWDMRKPGMEQFQDLSAVVVSIGQSVPADLRWLCAARVKIWNSWFHLIFQGRRENRLILECFTVGLVSWCCITIRCLQ